MIDLFLEMLEFEFLARSIAVGVPVSLCAALLGVSLVLKRYSMIGDGLSHVGFGALAAAMVLNMAPLQVALPVVMAAAFLLLRISESSRIKGDAAIALISTSSLAIGVMTVSVTTGMNVDVCNYMFGSILAVSKSDAAPSILLSLTVILLYLFFYPRIFAVTFDETFARASGVRAGGYNTLLALLTAVTIVLGMRLMGAMLISSLIIFPPLTAMRIFKSFRMVVISSAVISVIFFLTGMTVSYVYSTPAGASIVCVNLAGFLIFSGIGAFLRRDRGGTAARRAACLLLCGGLLLSAAGTMTGCAGGSGGGEKTVAEKGNKAEEEDLIDIREKLFVSYVNEIYINAEDYLGRTIRLEGMFKEDRDAANPEKSHAFVYRIGPGCCSTDGATCGFEFRWDGPMPQDNDWIRVTGTLESYRSEDPEDELYYLRLAATSVEVLDSRGAEQLYQ